LHHLKH